MVESEQLARQIKDVVRDIASLVFRLEAVIRDTDLPPDQRMKLINKLHLLFVDPIVEVLFEIHKQHPNLRLSDESLPPRA
ncbi:MAG: hypothetical protein BWY75_01507 [bacterium ADurb.Bin425]|nr:MAG: hypothetical protein BWY75_01507 [bacterium ADurb.Bin425]